MVILGFGVTFVETSGHLRWLPQDLVLVHDPTGKRLRRCDVYIAPIAGLASLSDVDPRSRDFADSWYDSEKLHGVAVALPSPDWVALTRVREIRYHAQRQHRYHPFETSDGRSSPQVLYENRRTTAWKVRLPSGCLIEARGFVKP